MLAVELLNVLHRLLLTRDPPAVQLQVTAVVQETIRAAHDHLQRQKTAKGLKCYITCMQACRLSPSELKQWLDY